MPSATGGSNSQLHGITRPVLSATLARLQHTTDDARFESETLPADASAPPVVDSSHQAGCFLRGDKGTPQHRRSKRPKLPSRPVIDVCVYDSAPIVEERPDPLKRRFDWVAVVECGNEGDAQQLAYYGVPGVAFVPSTCGSVGCPTCGPRVRKRGLGAADGLALVKGHYAYMVTMTSLYRVTRRDKAPLSEVAFALFLAGRDPDTAGGLQLDDRVTLVGYSREEFVISVRKLRTQLSRRDRDFVWWGGWDVFEAEPRPDEQSQEPCPARFWPGDVSNYTEACCPVEGAVNPERAAQLHAMGFDMPGPRQARVERHWVDRPLIGPMPLVRGPVQQLQVMEGGPVAMLAGELVQEQRPMVRRLEVVVHETYPPVCREPEGHTIDHEGNLTPRPDWMPPYEVVALQKRREPVQVPAAAEVYRRCLAGEGCLMCGGTGHLAATHLHAHLLVIARPFWAGRDTPDSERQRLHKAIFDGEELSRGETKLLNQTRLALQYKWRLMPGGVGFKSYAERYGLGHTDVTRLKDKSGKLGEAGLRYLSKVATRYLAKVSDKGKPYEDWPEDFGGAEGGRLARFMHAGAWLQSLRSVQPWGGCLGLSSRTKDPGTKTTPQARLPDAEARVLLAWQHRQAYWSWKVQVSKAEALVLSAYTAEDALVLDRWGGKMVTLEEGREALAHAGVPRVRVHRAGKRRLAAVPFEGGLTPFALSIRTNSAQLVLDAEQASPVLSTAAPAVQYASEIYQTGVRDACEPYCIQHEGWYIWMVGDRVADMSRGLGLVPWLKVAEVAAERVWSVHNSGALRLLQRARYGLGPSDDLAGVDWEPGDDEHHREGFSLAMWMWRKVLHQLDGLGAPKHFSWALWRNVVFHHSEGPPVDFQGLWDLLSHTKQLQAEQSTSVPGIATIALD